MCSLRSRPSWRRSCRAAAQTCDVRGAPEEAADAKIDSFVKDNKARVGVRGDARAPSTRPTQVMLFMKGTKIFPQCGFSNMAVQILNAIGADFERGDAEDDFILTQIVYSDWPTIPLYVDGEFVGGSDIMLEMYQAGEPRREMIEVAAASCYGSSSSSCLWSPVHSPAATISSSAASRGRECGARAPPLAIVAAGHGVRAAEHAPGGPLCVLGAARALRGASSRSSSLPAARASSGAVSQFLSQVA